MKTNQFRRTRVAAAVAGLTLALGAGQAVGTGFQLNENSASSLGNAFAAGAAFTDDASAMWWNPAALSQQDLLIDLRISDLDGGVLLEQQVLAPADAAANACART